MHLSPLLLGAASALAAVASSAAAAGTLQINPVLVEIGEGQRSGSVTIRNMETTPVVVRAYALGWRQADGEDRYEETASLIVSPPVATIPPGGTQIVRVGPRAPAAGPQSYRLIVEEVPEAAPAAGIRVALRLNLPLYIRVPAGAPADLGWSARRGGDGRWAVEARNGGAGWVRVDARAAEAATGLRFPEGFAFGTVLPGGARRWALDGSAAVSDATRLRRIQAGSDGDSLPPRHSR